MSQVFVDVSNVASIREGRPGYAPWNDALRICDAWIEEHPSDTLVLLVDWGFFGYLEHKFPDQFPSFARAKETQRVKFAKSGKTATLIETPENIAADEEILRRAHRYADRQIISGDHYRPYRDDYPWLQGFELQMPVIEGDSVRFEPIFLRPLDEDQIEYAEEREEAHREELEQSRAARRNRHQRRRAARATGSTPSRPPNRAPGRPAAPPRAQNAASNASILRRSETRAGSSAANAGSKPPRCSSRAGTSTSKRGPERQRLPIWAIPIVIAASLAASLLIPRLF